MPPLQWGSCEWDEQLYITWPHTSLSALTCQAPYVIANIIPNTMAVLDFQFDGRVHQPPADQSVQQPAAGATREKARAPAGDHTCFGYGYLAPPPCKLRCLQYARREKRQTETDHGCCVLEGDGGRKRNGERQLLACTCLIPSGWVVLVLS